jgi:Zn-finger in Ran binding protein and others
MARSQLALEKRAEKRSVPIEEQRLKDARKKSAKGSSVDSGATKAKKQIVVKKVEPVKDDNDWICTKCTNKNFHHRESCNRCQDSRENQRAQVTESAQSITSEKPKLSTVKKVVEPKAVLVDANQNWLCASCKNDNFPTRQTCNRCQSDKPTSNSSSVSAIVGVIKSTKTPTIAIAPKAPSDRIPKGMGIVSGKSLSWGKQATEKEIAENKRLLEVMINFGLHFSYELLLLHVFFLKNKKIIF